MLAEEILQYDNLEDYLTAHENKGQLRFVTCGSVDDGKSTLIGRLLYDSKMIFEDHLQAVENDSRKVGTTGEKLDLALLVDGLQAEREQGITIDVAYRYFATESRKFVVIDAPGHEQYTRNMVTGASNADVAIILIDARYGILPQTRRHSFLVSLLGIKEVIVAVNKMDLVDHSQAHFDEISSEYRAFASSLNFKDIHILPMSALNGDNIVNKTDALGWFDGPSLMTLLEEIQPTRYEATDNFRLPVQWVNRPNLNFRGFSGTIAGGSIRPGDAIQVFPSGKKSTVKSISTYDGNLPAAGNGEAVTLTLEDEIDISRGDLLVRPEQPPVVADQFAANLVWMSEEALLPGRQYLLKMGTRTTPASVTSIEHRININSLEEEETRSLGLNDIALCNISATQALAFDPYLENQTTGSFILIDRISNATVAAGMVTRGLNRSTNVVWHDHDVNKQARARLKGQKPGVLWFTGLSGSGKSTTANALEKKLLSLGVHTYILDGDNVRHGLNKDLGFSDHDRVENIRRVGEVSRLFVEAGMLVIVAFISPFQQDRQLARDMVEEGEFIEVFVDTPLETCEERDPKGLYKKARAGEIPNFTGISADYEAPESPEIRIDTSEASVDQSVEAIIDYLRENKIISA